MTDSHGDSVHAAAQRHEAAARAYLDAENAYEDALMRGAEPDALRLAKERRRYADTLSDLVKARRQLLPPFEEVLADPTFQADPISEILTSIEAYSKAPPATATARGTNPGSAGEAQ